ncbi:RICIN domain-containing protein [Kibdelosporangium lantanae]|uniref:RICIN domain-containing protein n=1 Tax=Kibdelosporangium lantanae TaxID=1497396 RepID=A0ABW3M8I0_9PSEU
MTRTRILRSLGALAAGITLAALLSPATSQAMATQAATAASNTSWYGPYVFTSYAGGRCLAADSQGLGQNGTRIWLWDCYPPSQQGEMWWLHLMPYSNTYGTAYQVVGVESRRCLDAAAQDGGRNGTHIQLWDCLGAQQTNQLWWVYRNDYNHGYVLKNVASGRVLDAAAQDWGLNGARVQLWDDLGDNQLNQRWTETTW